MTRLASVVACAAVLSLGCGSEEKCLTTVPSGHANDAIDAEVAIAGAPFTIRLQVPRITDCGGHIVEVSDMQLSATDEANHAVATTVLNTGHDDETFADVRFTPDHPGVVHLTARFEPSIGLTQTLVIVAESHADAGVVVAEADRECVEVNLRGDVLLCQHDSSAGNQLAAIVDGHTVQELIDADFVAVSEHRAWVVSGENLAVYDFDDAGFHPKSQLFLNAYDETLIAHDDGALLAGASIGELSFDSTGQLVISHSAVSPLGVNGGFAQWVPGVGVADMGAQGITDWCVATADGGYVNTCVTAAGTAVGADDDGVWYLNGQQLVLGGLLANGGTRTLDGVWAGGSLARAGRAPGFRPLLLSNLVCVPRYDAQSNSIVIESYGPLGVDDLTNADDDCVYSVLGTEVTCRRRR